MTAPVLDASAVLALLFDEPGAELVRGRVGQSLVSAVNYSETLGRAIDRGIPLERVAAAVSRLELTVVPFDAEAAEVAASLRATTRPHWLSFADRACLALGLSRSLPVLTADRSWGPLKVGVSVEVIR
jgi:PIN domain nuclease of toxin-antitoxin system